MNKEEIEVWKTIEDYPDYMISNLGNVKSLKYGKEKILKQKLKIYYYVHLSSNGKSKYYAVHRLVATAFLPNPNNYSCVNHKDENKQNNKVDNLEWCTQEYNINYGTRNEKASKALSKPIVQIDKSGLIIGVYDSTRQIERELNINHSSISQCCNGKLKSCGGFKWEYLEENKKAS